MAAQRYRFAEFALDCPRFQLERADARVVLQPKALDLLIYLVRHRDRVVSKDELLGALWPDVVVSEASLSKAVAGVRRALGDAGHSPQLIQTIRGKGIRFVADVVEEGAPEKPSRPDTIATLGEDRATFVGRADVLAGIDAALASARRGTGRLVLLAGEAGMGKTRTAHEAAARAEATGITTLVGWCHEGEGAPDLWPWVQILRHLMPHHDPRALAAGLGDGLADLAELVPVLRPLLPPRPRRAAVEPQQARFRLLDTTREILARAARAAPQFLVLDDFHRADRASLALLEICARELQTMPVAVLVAHRGDELPARHPLHRLSRMPGVDAYVLAGLARAEVARLVEAELGAPVPEPVGAAIHERSEGNPFFVRELAHALAAARRGDADALATTPLPIGIQEVLQQRLDRLSSACRALVEVAAALDRDVELALIARASGCAPQSALALLDEAHSAHVVRHVEGRWRLAHALVRDAVLAPMSALDLARLHRRIAEAIEEVHCNDLDPYLADLARHYGAGAASGGAERAVDYARWAGDRAVRMLAYDEAAVQYRRALDALTLLDRGDAHTQGELLLALGEAEMFGGRPESARATLARAAEAARQLAAPELLARAALARGGLELSTEVGVFDPGVVALLEEALAALPEADSVLGVRLMVRLALAYAWSPSWERQASLARRALDTARRIDDPVALGYALYGRHWVTNVDPRGLGTQLAGAEEMLVAAQHGGSRDLELAAHSCRFLALLQLGQVVDAEDALARYEAIVAEVRVPRYRWRAHFYRTALASLAGRYAEVEERALRTLADEASFRPGDAGQVGWTQIFWLRWEQGRALELEGALRDMAERFPSVSPLRAAAALLHLEAGRADAARRIAAALTADDCAAVPRTLHWVLTLVVLGEVCAGLGDGGASRRLYQILEPWAPRTVLVGVGVACLGSLDLFLGRLAAAAGDDVAAMRHLETAVGSNARMGARPYVAWAEYELGRLLARRRARGERERARACLGRAREIASALGMTRLETHVARTDAAGGRTR